MPNWHVQMTYSTCGSTMYNPITSHVITTLKSVLTLLQGGITTIQLFPKESNDCALGEAPPKHSTVHRASPKQLSSHSMSLTLAAPSPRAFTTSNHWLELVLCAVCSLLTDADFLQLHIQPEWLSNVVCHAHNTSPTMTSTATSTSTSTLSTVCERFILYLDPSRIDRHDPQPPSIVRDCDCQLNAPLACKKFLTTTLCFRPPGNWSLSWTSPCPIALPAFVLAKSQISCPSHLVYSIYGSHICRSPWMWEVVAQSKFHLSFQVHSPFVTIIQFLPIHVVVVVVTANPAVCLNAALSTTPVLGQYRAMCPAWGQLEHSWVSVQSIWWCCFSSSELLHPLWRSLSRVLQDFRDFFRLSIFVCSFGNVAATS